MSTPFSAEQVAAHVERFLERASDRSKFDPLKLIGLLDADSAHSGPEHTERSNKLYIKTPPNERM